MHWVDGRLFLYLRRAVVAALVLALLAGILLPVYTDEVGWRLQERAWIDGVDKLYSENCGPSTLAIPPWFMLPVRWYSATFNLRFPDPLFVRMAGVGYALVFLWLLLRLVRRIGRSEGERNILAVIGTSLMGFGVLPLLLVWSRPEQPIFLTITAAILIASGGWRSPGNLFAPFHGIAYATGAATPAAAWRRSLGILALGVIALSYHFKAVMLIPAFALSIAFASRGGRTLFARGVAIALLLLATGSAAHYWLARLECPADPVIAVQHAHENLLGQIAVGSTPTLEVTGKLLGNYKPHKYIDMAAPLVHPMSQWLPADRVSDDEMHGWQGGMAAIWALALAAATVATGLMARRAWRERIVPPETVLALALFGTMSVWCVSQAVRHVYEVSFVLPMAMLAIVLALAAPWHSPRLRQAVAVLALAMGPLMLLSEVLVGSYYIPPLAQSAASRDIVPHQAWSVPVFGYHRSYRDISAAARACHLPFPRDAQSVLIDDVTYFAYMQSRLPEHELAILTPGKRGSISDPMAYLRSRGSSGVLLRCARLSPALRARAHNVGAYCCLGPND